MRLRAPIIIRPVILSRAFVADADFFDVGGPNNFAGDRADGNALYVIMPVGV